MSGSARNCRLRMRAIGVKRSATRERAHLGCTFADLSSASRLPYASRSDLLRFALPPAHPPARFRVAGTGRIDVRFRQAILAAAILGCFIFAARTTNRRQRIPPHEPSSREQTPRAQRDPRSARGQLIARAQSPSENSNGGQAEASIARSRVVLAAYCVLIVGASLFGGWLPRRLQISHTRMQVDHQPDCRPDVVDRHLSHVAARD